MDSCDKSIADIIQTYNKVVRVINDKAHESEAEHERSYGGHIRAVKGKLQEDITHSLVMIAWGELGGNENRIDINKQKISIPIKASYIEKIDNNEVKNYIKENIKDYFYRISVDKHIYIDSNFVMGIECKSYTENAMIKRILIDFDLILTKHNISCYLFQLESQLGGDYSQIEKGLYGSKSTHTIMSYFNCKLNIITLLNGERDINSPIHKVFKELKSDVLIKAKNILKKDLEKYI